MTKLFASLGWTRDDLKWSLGILASVIIGLAALGDTVTQYGIPASWLPYIRLAALVVGIVSGKMATSGLRGKNDPPAGSVNPSKLPPAAMLLFVVALGATMPTMSACAKKAPNLTPAGQAAVVATRVVRALDVLRDTAVDASKTTPPLISPAAAQRVVVFHQAMVQTISAVPNGWQSTVLAGLTQLKDAIPAHDYQQIAPYVDLLRALIAELG